MLRYHVRSMRENIINYIVYVHYYIETLFIDITGVFGMKEIVFHEKCFLKNKLVFNLFSLVWLVSEKYFILFG